MINRERIRERIENCTNFQDVVSRLKLGFDVDVEAGCGCVLQIDGRGQYRRIRRCGDEECQGYSQILEGEMELVLKPEQKKFQLGFEIPTSLLCFECGSNLNQDRILLEAGENESEVFIKTRCPFCGILDKKTKWMDNDLLID